MFGGGEEGGCRGGGGGGVGGGGAEAVEFGDVFDGVGEGFEFRGFEHAAAEGDESFSSSGVADGAGLEAAPFVCLLLPTPADDAFAPFGSTRLLMYFCPCSSEQYLLRIFPSCRAGSEQPNSLHIRFQSVSCPKLAQLGQYHFCTSFVFAVVMSTHLRWNQSSQGPSQPIMTPWSSGLRQMQKSAFSSSSSASSSSGSAMEELRVVGVMEPCLRFLGAGVALARGVPCEGEASLLLSSSFRFLAGGLIVLAVPFFGGFFFLGGALGFRDAFSNASGCLEGDAPVLASFLSWGNSCSLRSQRMKQRRKNLTHILRITAPGSLDRILRIWHGNFTHLGLDLHLLTLTLRQTLLPVDSLLGQLKVLVSV